jgi:hypothetical protein
MHDTGPTLFVQVKDNFGVCPRTEAMSTLLELGHVIPIVVHFTVEDDPKRLVLVTHRLMTGRGEVNDAQTAVSQAHSLVVRNVEPGVVGAAVNHCVAHGDERKWIHLRRCFAKGVYADDATHVTLLYLPRSE